MFLFLGVIFANSNHEPPGTIENNNSELVYNEMENGNSWLRVRDQKPCCDCVYQWLCPSPSNYELVMKRPNLCKVFYNAGLQVSPVR